MKSENKVRFKQVAVFGREDLNIDIFVTKDSDLCTEMFKAMYPKDKQIIDTFEEYLNVYGFVCSGATKEKPFLILYLRELKQGVVVHELIHVLFALQNIIGLEITKEAEEWVARMGERLFNDIMNKKDYATFSREDIKNKLHKTYLKGKR